MFNMNLIAKELSKMTGKNVDFTCFEDDNMLHFQLTKYRTYKSTDIDGKVTESVLINNPDGRSGYYVYEVITVYPEQVCGFLNGKEDITYFIENGYTQSPIDRFESYVK